MIAGVLYFQMMMNNMKKQLIRNKGNKKAVALLVVLFIVMAVTILSLGFLSKNDVELACGENMRIRTEMDYLTESGLEQAKGFILNPQDVSGEYWMGVSAQQLIAGSDDYYNVSVVKTGSYNYKINCTAYREKSGAQITRGKLAAELRLDPCFAYYQYSKKDLFGEVTINGDAYFCDDVKVYGQVWGDVYSKKTITKDDSGTIQGQQYQNNSAFEAYTPELYLWNFEMYYYIGSTMYSVEQIAAGTYADLQCSASASNPAGVFYCDGNLELTGNCSVNGMLSVKDDLRLREGCNLTITAVKNFPALLVGHDLSFEEDNCQLEITGLTQIDHHIDLKSKIGGVFNLIGTLYIFGDGIINTTNTSVTVTASQEKGSIQTWLDVNTPNRFSPAARAFFKSIERVQP